MKGSAFVAEIRGWTIRRPIWRHVVLISGLLLIAVNLRPAIAGLAPLAERMQGEGLEVEVIGMLTTVPLVLFGLAGLLVGAIGNWIGFARALGVGLQSLLFYSSVAWLPTMLQLRGMSETASYGWPTVMQLGGCAASLVIPTLAGRARSQSSWSAACAVMTGLGICGILWLPLSWVGMATIVLGLGLNAGFGMALLVIAMRSRDAETAGNLSSMAQAIGYLAAAPFPWLIGWLQTATDSWPIAYGSLVIPAVGLAIFGALAGRSGFVK